MLEETQTADKQAFRTCELDIMPAHSASSLLNAIDVAQEGLSRLQGRAVLVQGGLAPSQQQSTTSPSPSTTPPRTDFSVK